MIRPLLISILMLLAPALHAGVEGELITRVQLRSTVRLDADQAKLTLGDLARIEGPQAETLRGVEIDPLEPIRPGEWSLLSASDVREQIKDAEGVRLGALVLSGSDIRLTRRAAAPVAIERTRDSAEPATEQSRMTIRQQIERWLLARLKTTREASRIRFDERDNDLLSTPSAGRIIELREIGRSQKMVVGVVVFEGERVVVDRTIQVEVLVEQPVRVATRQIKRRTAITEENTRVERRWLPVTAAFAEPGEALGLVTVTTIDPGRLVLSSMLEQPVLVKRGDIVNARSIAGSVSVSLMVRAKESGKLGDIIELESRDRKQQFRARVAGRGRVVIVHQPTTPAGSSS